MDSLIEENGNATNADESHSLSRTSHQTPNTLNSSTVASSNAPTQNSTPIVSASSVLTTTNVLQYHLPAASHNLQVQSVIQAANQSSVIQTTATNVQSVSMQKDGVLYVSKPGSTVIHTTPGNTVQIKNEPLTQQHETNSEESLSDEDSPQGRRELTRRPSYHKIFTEISGPDMSGGTTLQIAESGGIVAIENTGSSSAGTFLHLQQDGSPQFYLPNRIPYNNNSIPAEEQTRKREIRLQKNREAARECRRKKKEYIKCLENRVAVLENQNKALIEELKSLKELYCQTKND